MKKQSPTLKQKQEAEFSKRVDKAISDLKLLSKKHGEQVVRTASYRLWRALSEKDRAQRTIQEKEKELAQLKSKFKV